MSSPILEAPSLAEGLFYFIAFCFGAFIKLFLPATVRVHFFLLFMFIANFSIGQFIQPVDKDSILSSLCEYKFQDKLTGNNPNYIDTLPESLLNQPLVFFNLKTNLGNSGTPLLDLTNQKLNQSIGFNGQFDHLDSYRFSKRNTFQYDVNKAYTEFNYLNGSNAEESFSVLHTQKVRELFNLGFRFNSLKSEGFFARQQTQHRNVALVSNFNSKNKRYYAEAGVFFNKAIVFENGGISDTNSFFQNSLPRNLIPVNLNNSSNKSSNRSVYFNQYYRLNNSSEIDSNGVSQNNSNYEISVYHNFEFIQSNYLFSDLETDSSFYATLDANPSGEYWSKSNFEMFDNSFGLTFNSRKFPFQSNFSFQQQFFQVGDYETSYNFNNQIVNAEVAVPVFNVLKTDMSYSQVLSGYNSGDGRLVLNSNFEFSKKYQIGFTYKIQTSISPYIYLDYSGTNFSYKNSFNKERVNEISVNQNFLNVFKVDIGSGLFNNGIYFNDELSAVQSNTLDEYYFLNLNLELENKRFFLSNNTRFQQFSNSQLFPLPKFISFTRAYVKGWIFDHHMFVNLGADIFYTSQFRGFGYSPLTRQFFTNTTENRFGNYPYIDLFFACKVKTARIFVKASHLNQGFTGDNYFLVNNYPYHDFSLRIGFSWSFLN